MSRSPPGPPVTKALARQNQRVSIYRQSLRNGDIGLARSCGQDHFPMPHDSANGKVAV